MRIVVVDTETTGDTETDQVCEVAAVTLNVTQTGELVGVRTWSSLFRPTVPVRHEARAAHHITDEQLIGASLVTECLPLPIVGDIVAAHLAEFDVRMLVQSGVPRTLLPERVICTWRCSMHLWPQAPKHSNQTLRYYLGVEPLKKVKGPPHRALPDALVTASLLLAALREKTPEQLVELTTMPVMLHTVRFGKYRGQLWETLDDGYLHWILSKDFDADAKFTAQHWINERRKCHDQQKIQ